MNKINITLVLLVIALAAVSGLLGKIAWDRRELNRVNNELNEQLMQSKLEIGRAWTQFGDAQSYATKLQKSLQDEINAKNAEITRYGELKVKYETLQNQHIPGQVIIVTGDPTTQFNTGMWYQAVDEKTLVPMNQITAIFGDFRLDATCLITPEHKNDLSYKLHLSFTGELVETITPSGAINHYVNLWEIDEKGNKLDKLTLIDYKVVVDDQRKSHFHWWVPHVDIALIMGASGEGKFEYGGSFGITFMGYGLNKNTLTWKFPRLSMDLTKKAGIGLTPILYNLGETIPLISNLWIGPHFSYALNKDREWMLGLILGATL